MSDFLGNIFIKSIFLDKNIQFVSGDHGGVVGYIYFLTNQGFNFYTVDNEQFLVRST